MSRFTEILLNLPLLADNKILKIQYGTIKQPKKDLRIKNKLDSTH